MEATRCSGDVEVCSAVRMRFVTEVMGIERDSRMGSSSVSDSSSSSSSSSSSVGIVEVSI